MGSSEPTTNLQGFCPGFCGVNGISLRHIQLEQVSSACLLLSNDRHQCTVAVTLTL